jgi:hypothetical protein
MFRSRREPLCRKIQGMLSEYIDNRLGSEDKSLVEHHLESCEACSKELESLRMTVRLLHRVSKVSVPRSFTIPVPEPKREGILGPTSLRWLRPATAVAAIVLVVLLAGDFLNVFGHEAEFGGGILLAPTGNTVFLTTPEGEGNMTDMGANVTAKAIPAPTPEGAGNVTEGNASMAGAGFTASGIRGSAGPPSIPGKPPVSWPLHQIEIAMGVVVFALATLTIFSARQRRKGVRVRKVH